MRRKIFKKALAGTLTATMMIGMSVPTFAVTGTTTGSGSGSGTGAFEGHVDKDVVVVTLPTDNDTTTFAYKMDPEGLIAATNSVKYSDSTFEPGANVYFQSATNTWTKDSAKLKVTNKGTVDVDVTVTAKTDANSNVAMSTTKTFESTDTDAKLYLGLQVANQAEVAVDTTDTAGKVTVGLKGNGDNYEITSVEGGGYGYTAKSGVPDTAWNSFEFGLTGACNPNGNYSASGLAGSNVTVTWSYAVRADDSSATLLDANAVADAAPSVEMKTYTMTGGQDVLVDINLGAGNLGATDVTSVSYVVSGKTYSFASGEFSVENDKLVLSHSKTDVFVNSGVKNREVTIKFDDAANTTGKIILTTAD